MRKETGMEKTGWLPVFVYSANAASAAACAWINVGS
jgi:hypothetical protein